MTREEWDEWKGYRVTKEVFQHLGLAVQHHLESLGAGSTIGANADETAQLTAERVGIIKGLRMIQSLEPEPEEGMQNGAS